MIDDGVLREVMAGDRSPGISLLCDHCEEWCKETFDTWDEAVAYKRDKRNGWRSVKAPNGDWYDLCPECNTPEVVAKLKGGISKKGSVPNTRDDGKLASRLADEALDGWDDAPPWWDEEKKEGKS